MYCEWFDKTTKLYFNNHQLLRIYHTRKPVQCASVSGEGNSALVSITMNNGHTSVYKGDGTLIRP